MSSTSCVTDIDVSEVWLSIGPSGCKLFQFHLAASLTTGFLSRDMTFGPQATNKPLEIIRDFWASRAVLVAIVQNITLNASRSL
jgi:hypothetical protein